MTRLTTGIVGVAAICAALLMLPHASSNAQSIAGPIFTADGRLQFPKDFRTWAFLSSGFDMSYVEGGGAPAGDGVFDNVFVDRAAYDAFQKTGKWPDRTMFVLEARQGAQAGSINKNGRFQTNVATVEVHVKDSRLKGGIGFFAFNGDAPAQRIDQTATCYSCHLQHGAVDSTFVQFYPTLLPIARAKKTLSSGFLSDEAGSQQVPAEH